MSDYEIVEIRKDHIFPYVIRLYVSYQHEKVWYFKLMPPMLFRAFERRFGWHTLVTARPGAWAAE